MFKYITGVLLIISLALGVTVKVLLAKNQDLQVQSISLEASIKKIEGQRKEDQLKNDKLNEENRTARAEVQKLRDVFAKHNMESLSLRKPGLMENVINTGTRKVWAEFRLITDPTEKEKSIDEVNHGK